MISVGSKLFNADAHTRSVCIPPSCTAFLAAFTQRTVGRWQGRSFWKPSLLGSNSGCSASFIKRREEFPQKALVVLRRKSVLFLTNLSTCQGNWLGSDDVSYEHLWDTVIPFGALQLQAEGERGPCRHGQMLPVFLGSFQLWLNDKKWGLLKERFQERLFSALCGHYWLIHLVIL